MKILVTGGTGFLGRRVVAELLTQGYTVRCLVRSLRTGDQFRADLISSGKSDRLELVTGSLNDFDDCLRFVHGCERVVHVAAAKTGATAVLFTNTVSTTRTLVSAAQQSDVSRFVLVSSLAVYDTDPLPRGSELTEICGLDPRPERRDPYTFAKVAQEHVCWEAHRNGLPLVVIRPGVIYGPGSDYLTTRVGLRFGSTILRMGGWHRLPYTFVDNCARAIALAVEAEGVSGHAFNIIDDDLPTGRQLIKLYRESVGPIRSVIIPLFALPLLSRAYERYHVRSGGLVPPVFVPYRVQAQWKPLRYPNRAAKSKLSWTPTVPLIEGLRRTTNALRESRAL